MSEQAESPDGRVRVITFPEGGGVFVLADFSDLTPKPKKVRFVRGLDHTPVRSGNDAWAPGGQAIAFDREAPSGEVSFWYAIPITRVGGVYVDGTPTLGVPITAPSPDLERDFWLKSLAVPQDLRLSARMPAPTGRIEGRDFGQRRPGARFMAGGWDTPIVQPITFTFRTDTPAEYQQLEQLVSYGPMLLQTIPLYGIEDQFVKLGTLEWSYLLGAYDPQRNVTITFNPCARPPTEAAPLLIPGRTFGTVAETYASFQQIVDDLDEFYDLMIIAPPLPGGLEPESGGVGDEGEV